MLARVRASMFIPTDVWEGYQCAAAVAEMAPRLPALRHQVMFGEVVGDDGSDFVRFFQERPRPRARHQSNGSRRRRASAVHLRHHRGARGGTAHPDSLYAQLLTSCPAGTGRSCVGTRPSCNACARILVRLAVVDHQWRRIAGRPLRAPRVDQLLDETGIEHVILVASFLGEFLAGVHEDGMRLPRLREITVGGTEVSRADDGNGRGTELATAGAMGMTEGGLSSPAPGTRRTGPRAASAAPASVPRPSCARWPQRRRSTRRPRAGS